jgi:hypothetical protein
MNRTFLYGLLAVLVSFLAGCSTVESRIESNQRAYASLSPADQALVHSGHIREGLPQSAVFIAWGQPDRTRSGSRNGHPYEAWIYTTTRSEFSYYPGSSYPDSFYWGGYGFRHRFWGHRHFFYEGPYFYDPFPEELVTYEVPYKTAFFENGRCTGWEYIR